MELNKKDSKVVQVYECGDYEVEVHEGLDDELNEMMIECWLGHRSYGVKTMMFGLAKCDVPTDDAVEDIIKANLERYIEMYQEDFED